MSLLEDLFSFVSRKRFLTQKLQESQALKAFILEPILTPSGLVDDLTHDTGFIIIDPNPGIDHSLDFPPDAHPGLDHAPDLDLHLSAAAIPPEHIELLPFIHDPEPAIPGVEDLFNSGIFTVGASGKVSIDYLFDGGGYQGQLAIFNLKDMEGFDLNTETGLADFIHEAAHRALSNSDLGHVVIADATEGAKFSGLMPSEWQDHNFGQYQGVKTFDMEVGDQFAVMLVPNGTVQQVLDGNQDADIRPLFSLHTVNPNEAFHAGQIADVTGDGNTFVLEDLRTDHWTDRDYNDIIFQVRGATGTAAHLDDVINPELDWRHSDVGQELIAYAHAQIEPVNPHPTLPEVPVANHPLIGIIDTGFSANNPDINYSNIILGRDYIDGDNNPLLSSGVGNEHGTHILGIIGATQNNGVGIDGLNDDAPIWVSRAVGSGHWSDSLVEFVDAAKASHQPNAVVNLSLDLTQINPDGSITTRYEFTPLERAAIEYARQNHVLIVAAAGNDGGVMSVLGQASQEFDNIITVGAADGLERAEYSSYGSGLDILAPGGTSENPILSAVGDGVGTMAGTSVAAAEVTGAISQVWAANPDLSYRQVIEILKSTATDLDAPGWDGETGSGLLNLVAAVSIARTVVPEDFIPLPWITPETWSGAGVVAPEERAASGGNSIATATVQPANFFDSDTVTSAQPAKYYQVTVNESGYIGWTVTRTNGSDKLPSVSLVNADGKRGGYEFADITKYQGGGFGGGGGGTLIDAPDPLSSSNGVFVNPGTYYVKVATNPNSSTNNYNLSTNFSSDYIGSFNGTAQFRTQPNYSANNSQSLMFSGSTAPDLNISDQLEYNPNGSSKAVAKYVLEVNEPTRLTTNFTSSPDPWTTVSFKKFVGQEDRLEPVTVFGGPISQSGNTSRPIELLLNKGRYLIEVRDTKINLRIEDNDPRPLQRPFTLNATLSPLNDIVPPDFAKNTLSEARDLGILSGDRAFQDFVGNVDANDYYRFTLLNQSNLNLLLNGLSDNADIELLDGNGRVIRRASNSGTIPDSLGEESLLPGTYYLRVYPTGGANTNYNLNLSVTPDPIGGSTETAFNIGILNGSKIFRDSVGGKDLNDYYRFELPASSDVKISLGDLSANANLDVLGLNSDGTLRLVSNALADETNPEEINLQNLAAGTYFVRVYPFPNNTNYTLSLTANPANNPPSGLGWIMPRTTFNVGETISFNNTNTTIYDSNGASDLARVDFWLQKDGGNWEYRGFTDRLASSNADGNWATFNYELRDLAPGSYKLKAIALDKSNSQSNEVNWNFTVLQPNSVPQTGSLTFPNGITLSGDLLAEYNRNLAEGRNLGTPSYIDSPAIQSYFGTDVERAFFQGIGDAIYKSKYGAFTMRGAIADYYSNNYWSNPDTRNGLYDLYSGLGAPTSQIIRQADGSEAMEFEGGRLTNRYGIVTPTYYSNASAFELVGKGAPDNTELQWKNDYSWYNWRSVGYPTGAVQRVNSGWVQEFTDSPRGDGDSIFLLKDGQQVLGGWEQYYDRDGNIKQIPKGAPYRVQGGILNAYRSVGGYQRQNGGLGFPTQQMRFNIGEYKTYQQFDYGFIAETLDGRLLIRNFAGQDIQPEIPLDRWQAQYFNNRDLAGNPVSTEDLGDGSGFWKVWGDGSPNNAPQDNFSARIATNKYLAPGIYRIAANADDGVRVRINGQTIVDSWREQNFDKVNAGYFYSNGGNYPIAVEYFESGGDAQLSFGITSVQPPLGNYDSYLGSFKQAIILGDSVKFQYENGYVLSYADGRTSTPYRDQPFNNPPASFQTGRVNTTTLRLRNQPSTINTIILDSLPQNTTLKIIQKVSSSDPNWTEWYEVEVNGKRGYVAADFVDIGSNSGSTSTAKPSPTPSPITQPQTQTEWQRRINAALDKLKGQYSITDPNGSNPGECVSLVKRFTQELGINMGRMGGNGGAKYGFINFNQPGLSLSSAQADKITFTGREQPQVGDIIFFDSTPSNPYGHVAVVQSVLANGKVIIEESNANAQSPNTYVTRGEIDLNANPPRRDLGRVMGWLRPKSSAVGNSGSSGSGSAFPYISITSTVDAVDGDTKVTPGGTIRVSGKAENVGDISFYLGGTPLTDGSLDFLDDTFSATFRVPSNISLGNYQVKAMVDTQYGYADAFGSAISITANSNAKHRIEDYTEYEKLVWAAYNNYQERDIIEGYQVDHVFNESNNSKKTGFYALGLTSPTKPPVLVIRGTSDPLDFFDDTNPIGIGKTQFNNNLSEIHEWLNNIKTQTGSVPDVIGHSLGGALAQLVTAEFTDKIGQTVTFNSPGIFKSDVQKFLNHGGKPKADVTHFIVSGDIVSMGGQAYLPGKVNFVSYSDTNYWDAINPVTEHMIGSNSIKNPGGYSLIDAWKGSQGEPDATLDNNFSVDWLSSPLFYYEDRDYLSFLLFLSRFPGGVQIATLLLIRDSTESSRRIIGLELGIMLKLFEQKTQQAEIIWNTVKLLSQATLKTTMSLAIKYGAKALTAISKIIDYGEAMLKTFIDLIDQTGEAVLDLINDIATKFGEAMMKQVIVLFSKAIKLGRRVFNAVLEAISYASQFSQNHLERQLGLWMSILS